MASEDQFDVFYTPANFRLAFERLQTAPRNLYKELYYGDLKIFGLFLNENINSLLAELDQNIFQPESSYKIFIPKKNNLVRPLSLLKFKDLLIYQALINVISDSVYDDVAPYYNNIIFGNVYNTSRDSEKDKIFFFKPWKQQWKKFEQKTKAFHESGYSYIADFDIASFFDTIDHYILCQILNEIYKIDDRITDLLLKLLEAFTSDSTHKTFRSKHGIPQGPLGSSFLADLYLLHLDLEMKSTRIDIQYIRYVDDIRIFSKNEVTAQKAISYLDLLARDLGLIPQINKILVSRVDNVDKLLRHQKSKFSVIDSEHKRKGGTLKTKTHRKLKERFINCFNPESNEEYLDKTLISFSLHRLNQDEDVKNTLLTKWENLYVHFDSVLSYLKKHFSEDQQVQEWLLKILQDENILFHHLVALIFKFFPKLQFIESVYIRYMRKKQRHWLTQYFIFQWLYENQKFDLIKSFDSDNYFLCREANKFKFELINDEMYKRLFIEDLFKSNDCLTALHGLDLFPLIPEEDNPELPNYNSYIKHISSQEKTGYIEHTLRKSFLILSPESFFNQKIWTDEEAYKELNISFRFFFEYRHIDPSKSLLNLNNFNNLVFDKMCSVLNILRPSEKYGVNLSSGCIEDCFPITNRYFIEINDQRNQRTDAHPYNKDGGIRNRISVDELKELFEKQKKILQEICSFEFPLC